MFFFPKVFFFFIIIISNRIVLQITPRWQYSQYFIIYIYKNQNTLSEEPFLLAISVSIKDRLWTTYKHYNLSSAIDKMDINKPKLYLDPRTLRGG